MRCCQLVFVCCVLSACAGPFAERRARLPPAPARVLDRVSDVDSPLGAAATSTPATSTLTEAERPRQASEPLRAIRQPLETRCIFRSASWSGSLRLRPKGPIYGTISSGAVVLSLGSETRDGSAVIEAGDARLKLLGVVDEPDLVLKKPTTLSGFVVPLAATSLAWQPTGTAAHVAVSLDVSDSFEVPAVAERVVACDQLVLDMPEYDVLASLVAEPLREGSIYGAIDLLLAPGSRPVARTKANSTHDVLVIRTSGKHSRVAIKGQGYYAIGWIESHSIGHLGMRGRGMRGPRVRMATTTSDKRTCAHSLELIAEVEGERAVVGVLEAGTHFTSSSLDAGDGFVGVKLFEPWFEATADAKLLVTTRDIAGC